jgi:hypothetical protein
MSSLGVAVVIVMCVAGIFLLVSGIFLLLRGGADAGGGRTEASLKEVIKVNVPAQALLVLVGAGLLSAGGYLAVSRTQDAASPIVPTILSAGTHPSNPSATPDPDASPRASASNSPPTVTLVYPTNGTSVSRSQGFIATGSSGSLGPNTIWILDSDSGYFVDEESATASGQWSATDKPLGDSSDHLPFDLTMIVVLANPHCALILDSVNATANDYIQNLPRGCKQVGQVTVNVAKP